MVDSRKRGKKLKTTFYRRDNVLLVAEELLGKLLVTNWNGGRCAGRIVECEAYAGIMDRASHAFAARRTNRNEMMYAKGGVGYVYLCYGIHHLFNVVTHPGDTPHAVLLRALEPTEGIALMLERTGKEKLDRTLTRGPGNLTKAMGITTANNGIDLGGDELWLEDDGFVYKEEEIATSPRIGVDYAGDDALLPYRFYVKGNRFVSGKPN